MPRFQLRSIHLLALCFCLSPRSDVHAFTEDPARLIRATDWQTPEVERKGFHVPEGFEVQLFADDEQLGGKPINLGFDTHGRLWVTSTQEYPYAVKKDKWAPDTMSAPGSKDTIRILEDTDGDGRADKVTIFAQDMNIPTGVLPYKDGCIAWSIPNILYLSDTQHKDKPEKADQRKMLFGPLGYERDTHGMISSMRLGLDGWIYATHGFSNTSHFQVLPQNKPAQVKYPNSDTLDISSGSVFRFRADGSAVQLWTCGQVNPFGLCWDSWGNLYSADCHSNPITQLIRGATYPQFGKTNDPIGFGPVMCDHAHGSTGIAGIVYIDQGVWGKEWDDHMVIGNPVTSKVNHDHIAFTGSTPRADELPDFITSDDNWFRPVDVQMGPDGALYIADFYNRIIGHYEIPLDHPGRDRKSGRIWRIVRKGHTGKLSDGDVAHAGSDDLTRKLGSPNLTLRGLALQQLTPDKPVRSPKTTEERVGAIENYLNSAIAGTQPPTLSREVMMKADEATGIRIYAMQQWLLRRAGMPMDTMGEPRIPMAAAHWARATAEFGSKKGQYKAAALALSSDPRDAAIAWELIQNMEGSIDFEAALDERMHMPPADVRLHFAWLLAMRASLQSGDWTKFNPPMQLQDNCEKDLFGIAHAVPTAGASGWMLSRIAKYSSGDYLRKIGDLRMILSSIARHLPAERSGELVDLVQKNFGNDLDTQLDLFFAVQEGRNGTAADDRLQAWATLLAQRLLEAFSAKSDSDWMVSSTPTAGNPSPWFRMRHKCADGEEADFLDSHPPGGEKYTGALHSKAFAMPDTLSFWLAGHRGAPGNLPHNKSYVCLKDAATGKEVARAYPPRNDVAGLVLWHSMDGKGESTIHPVPSTLEKAPAWRLEFLNDVRVGQPVYLEAVDGDSGTAYAWLAFGRFEPAVVNIPDLKSPAKEQRVRALAQMCGTGVLPDSGASLRVACLDRLAGLPEKETLGVDTRFAVAEALASRHASKVALLLAPLVRDPANARPWLEALSNTNADLQTPLAALFKSATHRQQVGIAEMLAAAKEGAEPLLKLAPPTVLAEPLVSSKIKALGDAAITERLTKLTASLPPPNAAVNELIAKRFKNFDVSKTDTKRGQQVFLQTCTPCHRIGVVGNIVGPQLDGIGARGPERLLEDILDPNREVDPAFRLHILKLKDGSVTTGLVRREQDGAIIYADVTGQEHSVPKTQVSADEVSPFSLMPSGLGEVLTEQQLHDLLAYLLERK